jgi:excisionase family DNA binding protein
MQHPARAALGREAGRAETRAAQADGCAYDEGRRVTAIVDALLAELDDDALDALAEMLAPRLADRLNVGASPWLNTEGAAQYLGCTRRRLYDLVQLRMFDPRRDGRRLLFRRADLDGYLEGSR